ncbi:hypothetical protein [Sporocytophaga myxococcoides]|uniref:hypothetical protein n=1 Tax=Sporocytophaga myxococcoides TaxID=153721 RepID=UPI00048E3908|nr:hypothetical protein [Sporocytophaga myxococcoides]
MKAEDFIEQIKSLKPTEGEMNLVKASEDYKSDFVKQFDITKISGDLNLSDEILSLVSNYHLVNLKIGRIKFDDKIDENGIYVYFGRYEADILILDKSDKKIKLLDHEDEEDILLECADNGESFLDAVFMIKKYFTLQRLNVDADRSQDSKCSVAFQCASLAGGNTYLNFYKNVLGCFQ